MVDARGRSCPEPVIMIKNEMKSKLDSYDMLVDNKTSVENVTRFAEHSGYKVDVKEDNGEYQLKITKK